MCSDLWLLTLTELCPMPIRNVFAERAIALSLLTLISIFIIENKKPFQYPRNYSHKYLFRRRNIIAKTEWHCQLKRKQNRKVMHSHLTYWTPRIRFVSRKAKNYTGFRRRTWNSLRIEFFAQKKCHEWVTDMWIGEESRWHNTFVDWVTGTFWSARDMKPKAINDDKTNKYSMGACVAAGHSKCN